MNDSKCAILVIIAILALILLLCLANKKSTDEKVKKDNIKENMCTCSGPMQLVKTTRSLDLSNPAGYQAKANRSGYNFIAV
jgi:hypothetical protein